MSDSPSTPVLRLFAADIRPLAACEQEALALLPPTRQQKALARALPEDRLHSIAAGLLLRTVLGLRSDDALCKNQWGKPFLPDGPHFSLSHGGQYALLAVFSDEVGADLELPRTPPHAIPVKFLTPSELAWYEERPSEERFCQLWTRLESALKADGRGLTFAKKRTFSVTEQGAPWYFETFTHDGHILSCAAAYPFTVEFTVIDPETLLKP